jgi:HEAT repeat protein
VGQKKANASSEILKREDFTMNLEQIRADLESADPQARMQALVALRFHDAEVAVPLLIPKLVDPEFIIRSFAATGLGKKQTSEAFTALIEVIHRENQDPNLLAEAANSLAEYGQSALPYLINLFINQPHWLIRLSILPALTMLDCPVELFELSRLALRDRDETVREVAIEYLAEFASSPDQEIVLEELLSLLQDESWRVRRQLALVLRQFDPQLVTTAIQQLRQDPDYRVVGAVLEGTLLFS